MNGKITEEVLKLTFNDKIIPLCNNIKNAVSASEVPSNDILKSLNMAINELFVGKDIICNSVLYTLNTDKFMFGVNVSPVIIDKQMFDIILGKEDIKFTAYNLEIDSKLVDDISGEELAAVIVEEISATMDPAVIIRVQDLLAELIAEKDGTLNIRASANYTQILIYAFKETIKRITDLIFKDKDAVGVSEMATILEIKDILVNIRENLRLNIYGLEEPETASNLGCLEWALMIYDDVSTNIRYAQDILNTAKLATASQLEIIEIDNTIKSITRACNEIISESTLLNEESLFKSLKNQGLKSIENDLYEFKIQVKACVEQEEALFIVKQLNTRIGILDDYLLNENISEADRNKWTAVDMEYRALREEIVKKKLSMRKNVGYYVDYDKINQIEG